jgi:hypothetical protein
MSDDRFKKIWDDQAAFNLQLRKPPATADEMMRMAKDFILYTESELHELLRLFQWKGHRRGDHFDNPAHRKEELADAFKCFISLCQYCGMSMDELFEAYWLKTAVVRQRYQEEWQGNLNRPCAVVDIDNVLCDYPAGMCDWIGNQPNFPFGRISNETLKSIRHAGWINAASLLISEEDWQKLKHAFRISGAKQHLPVFLDAKPFLHALRRRNLQIVLLTSRPIDRYPNMYTDTLAWLSNNKLPFDYIWWAVDKAERVIEAEVRQHIQLIVDDDPKYIGQYARVDLHSYWLRRQGHRYGEASPLIHQVTGLQEVISHYDKRIREQEAASWQSTQTQSIDPTLSTPEKNLPPK